jgi:Domain of unknown function (DUF4193)
LISVIAGNNALPDGVCHFANLYRKASRMANDYDAPRVTESDADESLEELTSRRSNDAATAVLDVDDGDTVDSFDLPDADIIGEELSVRIVPKQADEFVCSSCFLVQHHTRLALRKDGQQLCTDCV